MKMKCKFIYLGCAVYIEFFCFQYHQTYSVMSRTVLSTNQPAAGGWPRDPISFGARDIIHNDFYYSHLT